MKPTTSKIIVYIITLAVSIAYIFIGHAIATRHAFESGEPTYETKQTEFDNSAYNILGDITVHTDGTCTVKMGKETDEETLLTLLYGGEV